MADVNRTILSGRLATPPEIRTFDESTAMCVRFLVTTQAESPRRRVDVVPVVLWIDPGDTEAIDHYTALTAGRRVFVTAQVQRRFWADNDGRRSRLEIVADTVDIAPGRCSECKRPTDNHLAGCTEHQDPAQRRRGPWESIADVARIMADSVRMGPRDYPAFFADVWARVAEYDGVPPDDIKRAAERITQAFGIKGECDTPWIANVIANELGLGDGQGNYTRQESRQ